MPKILLPCSKYAVKKQTNQSSFLNKSIRQLTNPIKNMKKPKKNIMGNIISSPSRLLPKKLMPSAENPRNIAPAMVNAAHIIVFFIIFPP